MAVVRTCMCVHVHLCMCVYTCVCVCVCVCESMGICVHVCAYMCACVCTHMHAYVCMCVHVCVSVHVCEECPSSMSTRVSVELTTDLCKVKTLRFHSCWSQTEAEAPKDTSFLFMISHEGVLLILVLS